MFDEGGKATRRLVFYLNSPFFLKRFFCLSVKKAPDFPKRLSCGYNVDVRKRSRRRVVAARRLRSTRRTVRFVGSVRRVGAFSRFDATSFGRVGDFFAFARLFFKGRCEARLTLVEKGKNDVEEVCVFLGRRFLGFGFGRERLGAGRGAR